MQLKRRAILSVCNNSSLASRLAVTRDIALTILLRYMCVRVFVRPSVQIYTDHNSYIYGWFSNFIDTVVVLEEEKSHLKLC